MTRTFTYGQHSYPYSVEFTKRKTIGLEVKPDLRIIVRAPLNIDEPKIEAFLIRKWLWLERALLSFRKYHAPQSNKQYISGESFYYLGRQYMLSVEASNLDMVALKHGKLLIHTTHSTRDSTYTQKLVTAWLAKRRGLIFTQEYRRANEHFDLTIVPQLRQRAMVRRWGSHTAANVIYLNPRLIEAPRQAIYYVCIHELCHTAHERHDQAFYRKLDAYLPNWRTIKSTLEINFG